MKRWLTTLGLPALILATVLAHPRIAAADCAPGTVREHVTYAHTIVYGQVTAVETRIGQAGTPDGTYYTITNERVFKGSPKNPMTVYSSSYTSPSGTMQLSSVDYRLAQGESHMLYLRLNEHGLFETSACSGSHSGAATAAEVAVLGEGRPAAEVGVDPKKSAKNTANPIRIYIPMLAIGLTVVVIGATVLSTRRKPKA